MKEMAAQRGKSNFSDPELAGRAVEGIANDGMLNGGEVHTNLMRASGVELDGSESGGTDGEQRGPFRKRLTSPSRGGVLCRGPRKHADTASGVARDGEIDAAMLCG